MHLKKCAILLVHIYSVFGWWFGRDYWNSRYDKDGIQYTTWRGWWNNDYYYRGYDRKAISGSRCDGCICDLDKKDGNYRIRNCTGVNIKVENKNAIKLAVEAFPLNVKTIEISGTQLYYIPPNSFSKLKHLEEITIIKSKLHEIPDLSNCSSLKKLDLYKNKIQIFRHNFTKLPTSLEEIILIGNSVDKIPNGFFDLPNLKYLALGNNEMRYFPGNAFKNNGKLVYVGTDGNKISSISKENLEGLSIANQSLVHLNLSNNMISYIAPYALKILQGMIILDLHNNEIETIRRQVLWEMPKLVHLDMAHNKIKALTSQFLRQCDKLRVLILHSQKENFKMHTIFYDSLQQLPSLKEIRLGSNSLTKFPHPVFFEESWPNIRYLYLENNQISSLIDYSDVDFPPEARVYYLKRRLDFHPFERMPSLQGLYMRYNSLKEIGKGDLKYCTSLSVLDVGWNYLKENSIHEDAFNNSYLTALFLSGQRSTGIQYIPIALKSSKLTKLRILYLNSNRMTFILNATFSDFSTLETINLAYNKIIAIEDGSFPEKIVSLYLTGNKFYFKNQKQFQGLTALRVLDLSSNRIDIIPNEAFHGLASLDTLHLQYNRIGALLKTHFIDSLYLRDLRVSSNSIGYIEDGTFSRIRKSTYLYLDLSRNQLSRVPKKDFWNVKINTINMKWNKITRIHSNAFVNVSGNGVINLQNNRIEYISSYAFNNVQSSIYIGEAGAGIAHNKVKRMDSYSFYHVSASYLDLSHLQTEVISQNALVLDGLYNRLYLSKGKFKTIERNALTLGNINGDVDLSDNKIETIERNIFGDGTSFRNLDFSKNRINIINDLAFEGSGMRGLLNVNDNQLSYFPTAFKAFSNLESITINNNQIKDLPLHSLDTLTNMKYLTIESNQLTVLNKGVFGNNNELREILLKGNIIKHVPKFNGTVKKLEKMELSGVETIAKDAFNNTEALKVISFNTRELNCDCNWYDTILSYLNKGNTVENALECSRPESLKTFDKFKQGQQTQLKKRIKDFVCTPENIVLTAPADYTIQIEYDYPERYYPGYNNTIHYETLYFTGSCELADGTGVTLTGEVNNKTVIRILDEIQMHPGREYSCFLTMTYTEGVTSYNITSARSKAMVVTTKERKEKASSCKDGDPYECQIFSIFSMCVAGCNVTASMALNNDSCDPTTGCCWKCYKNCKKCEGTVQGRIKVDVTYYDFSHTNADFSASEYIPDDCCPTYIDSPYESWLAKRNSKDVSMDSFSTWFQSTSSNKVVRSYITLISEGKSDQNGEEMYTFWDDQYWAVNGKGFGAEGQRDCDGKELINLGFTSAIRTSFRFSGKENFHFAGGEDIWVYINKILVLSVIRSSKNQSNVECKSFQLKNATMDGYLIPKYGIVDSASKMCKDQVDVPKEKVNISLHTGTTYQLEIFHVERFPCKSEFLFSESGVERLTVGIPIDLTVHAPEDTAVNSIIGDFTGSDWYNKLTPYNITIENGNEEERFSIYENTTEMRKNSTSISKPRIYPNVTLHGETIIICPNYTNVSTGFPKTYLQPQHFNNINYPSVILTLKNDLDYEATSEYLLNITVKDGTGRIGKVFIMIIVVSKSDNCPVLINKTAVSLQTGDTPLSISNLLVTKATDIDTGESGRITYVVSEIKSKIPTITSKEYNSGLGTLWVNLTISWTITVNVFAVDNGTPRRGDYFQLSVSYKSSCDEFGRVEVNKTHGAIYFKAPGMASYNSSKHSYAREGCYPCTAGYFCPGDGRELNCIQNVETKHYYSYRKAGKCLPCPEGSLCHNGIIKMCPPDTYVKCNTIWCPMKCLPCPPGVHCSNGLQHDCPTGTFSYGHGPCQFCLPGSYTNRTKSPACTCCPDGEESTHMKDKCQLCGADEYTPNSCSTCISCMHSPNCACRKNPCFPGVECHNFGIDGSDFKCESCPKGYQGNGVQCDDIDECQASPCDNKTECVNLMPGFKCKGCPYGYYGFASEGIGIDEAVQRKQVCIDIDECKSGYNRCDRDAWCLNTNGSYSCGMCKPGFTGDGDRLCFPGDYCASGKHNCHVNATCISLGAGRFYCQCNLGFAGDGLFCGVDDDYDDIISHGISSNGDNCKTVPNFGQEDKDMDLFGDVCDEDDDDDGILDINDNCPFYYSQDQTDTDNDGVGDACDNCKSIPNANQEDIDNDGTGDACDTDKDGDGKDNNNDNCPSVVNTDQSDGDGDGVGDACDNCKYLANTNQADNDQSGFGDACEGSGSDADGDGVPTPYDNCPQFPNADQANADNDTYGDACDNDKDNDGVLDSDDNCMYVANQDQHFAGDYDTKSNPVGTACLNDYDGDGYADKNDVCPHSSAIHRTSFIDYTLIDLDASWSQEPLPKWRAKTTKGGRDIAQLQKTFRPSVLIGNQRYSDVKYSGVVYVNSNEGNDYIGVVFGYQTNKKFYVAMWRHTYTNLDGTTKAGIKGVQLKLVNSVSGPSKSLMEALWHSEDTNNQVKLLWQDPEMFGWSHRTPYVFNIEFRPSLGRMRLMIESMNKKIDSGYIYDTSILGGKLGIYTHGQGNVIWSKLQAKCLQRLNTALRFDGNSSSVTLQTLRAMDVIYSYTLFAWIKLHPNSTNDISPILCTKNHSACLYIKNRKVCGNVGQITLESAESLLVDTWFHLTLQYDAQDRVLKLLSNGKESAKIDMPQYDPDIDQLLYLGSDGKNFFKGVIDEVVVFNVFLDDTKIRDYIKLAGMRWPIHQRVIGAYYDMNGNDTTLLQDHSKYNNHGNLTDIVWIHSDVDVARFKYAYPNHPE